MLRQELLPVAQAICAASNYTLVGAVGEGVFKETYEAIEGDIRHALKVYRPNARAERIDREIDAMLRCNHPGIGKLRRVDSIFVGAFGTCLFSVEEFLGGGTLGQRVASHGLLSSRGIYALGELLVSAIAHIASNGLVHRDIKPENIMLREDGVSPVIVDFGLVRTLGEESLTLSWAPRGPGTPFFSPPEQLSNKKHLIDWRADQFSLGVSLAICAFGEHPYQLAEGESASEVVTRVAGAPGLSRRFVDRAIGAQLPALARMVSPWPVYRYRTPEALSSAWRDQRKEH